MPNNRLILIRSIARRLNGRVANVGRATLDALGLDKSGRSG